MEVLNLIKFWKPNVSETGLSFQEDEEGGDSYFDLKIMTTPAFCNKNGDETDKRAVREKKGVSSKRQILPLEYNFRPQSPIELLKSASKLSVLALRKQKSTVEREVDETEIERNQGEENRDLPIKFYAERRSSHGEISSTKLNLIKLLYLKLSKKSIEKGIHTEKLSESSSPSTASVSSPVMQKQGNTPASMRQVSRHLGKSKSASASATNSVQYRKENPFLQYEDAIESAILHCKRSLNSPNDSSDARRHKG